MTIAELAIIATFHEKYLFWIISIFVRLSIRQHYILANIFAR